MGKTRVECSFQAKVGIVYIYIYIYIYLDLHTKYAALTHVLNTNSAFGKHFITAVMIPPAYKSATAIEEASERVSGQRMDAS